jgi:hypothetical protein
LSGRAFSVFAFVVGLPYSFLLLNHNLIKMPEIAEDFVFNLEDDKEIAFMGACLKLIATRRAAKKRLLVEKPEGHRQSQKTKLYSSIVKTMETTMNTTYERVTFASNEVVLRSEKLGVKFGPQLVVTDEIVLKS